MDKKNLSIILLLVLGVLLRLYLSSNGNFIFNMDNARDMIDVREMVELHKLRLIGPPAGGIEGLYYGPVWYYMLSIAYLISNGDTYSGILMMIGLWCIGGWFLLQLLRRWGLLAILIGGFFWCFADIYLLATSYAFNPNPIILLMPVFVYSLERLLESKQLGYVFLTWGLAGAFFNFEMAFGVFMPVVILAVIYLSNGKKGIFDKRLLIGIVVFILFLLPQVIFDIKHNFVLTDSILHHLQVRMHESGSFNPVHKLLSIYTTYSNSLNGFFMNFGYLKWLSFTVVGFVLYRVIRNRESLSPLVSINIILLIIPMFGYLFLPMNLNLWHIGAASVSLMILVIFGLFVIQKNNFGKVLISLMLGLMVVAFYYSMSSALEYRNSSGDPSFLRNQVHAIDTVYQKAEGQDFRVYTYMPSVYDYPYQYLFWWYGARKYGFTPKEFSYAPNKPEYISNKNVFKKPSNKPDSDLVFLIKEPDDPQRRELWENNFSKFKKVDTLSLPPLTIDVLK